MTSKIEEAHFTAAAQEKESVTFKIRFSQFKKGEKGSHGSCLKWLTIIFSTLFMILGLICIILGIVYQSKHYPKLLFISKVYTAVITYFIFIGFLMIIAGVCGIVCMVRKSYATLIAYLVTVAFIVILHCILGALAFHNRAKADSLSKQALFQGYHDYYRISDAKDFMDWSQKRFKCCGEYGPGDYHAATKAPHHSTTLKVTTTAATTTIVASTTTTAAPTTVANTTTTASSTTVANTTTTAAPTTVANATTTAAPTTVANATTTAAPTTVANTTTTAAPTTVVNTTTTAAPTTTVKPTTTAAPTTTASKSTKKETTTPAKTTRKDNNATSSQNIVNAAAGGFQAFSATGLPETCCKENPTHIACINRPKDIFKIGCHKRVDGFLKSLMTGLGIFAFCMMVIEIISLIVASLDAGRVKEEGSYDKF